MVRMTGFEPAASCSFLPVSFLSHTLEVSLIFIDWSFPIQFSIYFHPRLTLGVVSLQQANFICCAGYSWTNYIL